MNPNEKLHGLLGNCVHENYIDSEVVINNILFRYQCTDPVCRKRFQEFRDLIAIKKLGVPDYATWEHAGPLLEEDHRVLEWWMVDSSTQNLSPKIIRDIKIKILEAQNDDDEENGKPWPG